MNMDLVKLLNDLLKDYSDVKVAQLTGIERTRINRIRNGRFKIEYSELEKIIEVFMVDKETAHKMRDAYLYEKLGKDKYNSRLLAKDFLSSMKYEESSADRMLIENQNTRIAVDFDITGEIAALRSMISVRNCITMIMTKAAQENDKIMIISSPFDDHLLSMLFTITSVNRELEIEHIYALSATTELTEPSTYYMEVAKAVYPIFMLNTNYRAYYSIIGHTTSALMPFQIITGKFTMIMSPDGTSGVIVKNQPVIEIHKNLFTKRVKECTPFIRKIRTPMEFLQHYGTVMDMVAANNTGSRFYSIDYEPCMLHFFKASDLGEMGEKSKYDPALFELFNSIQINLLPAFNSRTQSAFFTKRGVEAFIKTGQIAEIPEAFGLTFGYERRRELLQCVLGAMKNKKSTYKYYLLKESEFDPPLGLRFLGSGSKTDHLFVMSDSIGGVRSILSMSNSVIVSTVFEFIESLADSDMVYSQEKMIEYMENVIASM